MKIDRLLGILTYLLSHEKVTSVDLAQRFEVSKRTILRDIDTLSNAGIPVYTEQGVGGGISILPSYKLDKSILTYEELEHLLVGLNSVNSVAVDLGLSNLIQKLSPTKDSVISMKESIVIDLSSHYKNSLSEKIAALKSAIRESSLVGFSYYGEKMTDARVVEPYLIAFKWTAWYLLGYCQKRKDFRLFKLNRLWDLTVLEESFLPREIPEHHDVQNRGFSDDQTLRVRFDPKALYHLVEMYGPNCYESKEDGLYMNVPYTNEDFVFSWILGLGNLAEVVEPEEMRKKFGLQVQEMYKKYFIKHDI